nr:redoxin domain-containing protein [Bacteroidota bacterium]
MKIQFLLLLMIASILTLTSPNGFTQTSVLEPVGLGETMGDFTLTSYQGEVVSMSDFRGTKNVLLVFPRGKVLEDLWCPLCYYQYAELAGWDQKNNIRKKYDLEIFYVLPYPKDSINLWRRAANKGLQTIENWKNPTGYDTLT